MRVRSRYTRRCAVANDLLNLRASCGERRIATTSELDQNKRLSVATVKRICQGQGQITASAKYEKKITFAETHKLWLDSNFLPWIPANDEAIWRRIIVVVFENTLPIDKQDKSLRDTILRDEIEGVMAWMVEGERLRQTEGLGEAPDHFNEKKEHHHRNMDTLQQFIEEFCSPGVGLRGEKEAIYDAYSAWVGPEHAVSPKLFTTMMKEKGHELDRGRRYYQGITLKDPKTVWGKKATSDAK